MTTTSNGDRLSRALWEARRDGRRVRVDEADRPRDEASAYAVQRAGAEASGYEIAGFKIGATAQFAMDLLGVGGPFFGPLFREAFRENDAAVSLPMAHTPGIESEFAVGLAADLPRGLADGLLEGDTGSASLPFDLEHIELDRPRHQLDVQMDGRPGGDRKLLRVPGKADAAHREDVAAGRHIAEGEVAEAVGAGNAPVSRIGGGREAHGGTAQQEPVGGPDAPADHLALGTGGEREREKRGGETGEGAKSGSSPAG